MDGTKSFISPSGLYELDATCKNRVLEVTIRNTKTDETIMTISRSVSSFYFSWLTKGTEEYLQTSRNAYSQMFINLKTKQVYENSDSENSFCWVHSWLSPDGCTLVVNGCYWGCSLEYKFFDFTDPSKGWKPLRTDTIYYEESDDDNKDPEWTADGTCLIYSTHDYLKVNGKLVSCDDEEAFTHMDEYCDENMVRVVYRTREVKRRDQFVHLVKFTEYEVDFDNIESNYYEKVVY